MITEEVERDCPGKERPGPRVGVAKAARTSPPGTGLSGLADDLAFESDVMAWTEQANATILSLDNDNGSITVKIKRAE